MTARARKRLGLRKSCRLWLTPAGEVALCGLVLAALLVSVYAVGALVAP